MNDRLAYEVVVVGGGPAGMTAALYATRLGHRTAVFEEEGGRHAAVSHVHNVYGVSEDVSGDELGKHAADQLRKYGGDYHVDSVNGIDRSEEGFVVDASHATADAERVVVATGFTDRGPYVPELQRYNGRGMFYCLHCDAYELGDSAAFVLGRDDRAARDAMLLLNFTDRVDLLLDGDDPAWGPETDRQLTAHPVDVVEKDVVGAFPEDETAEEPWLGGLTFGDGNEREYRGGFAVYGSEYNTALAESLGCDLTDDGAVAVDDDGRTSDDGVYAVGDVTHGQNQTVIAMADGARAGMALHKELRRYPRPTRELDDLDAAAPPAAAGDLRARMRLVRERDAHAGLRGPPPDW
jgi:thioredoxin reductase (NADPH)